MKCRYMDEMTNGKGIVFAAGTPVSNDDIREKLVNLGIPEEEIAFIHEANSDK